MKNIKFIFSIFIVLIAIISCDSLEENRSDSNFSNNFGDLVLKDFIGQIVDINNNPIQSATIKIGSSSVLTDSNGVFIINQVSVYQKFAYITATKAGYINGSRSMVPTSGKNKVKIMLLQNTPLQSISSGITSEVSLTSGTKIVFDGAFMDENGISYSGLVSVYMFHLKPSDTNISQLMPGMLYAQDENGKEGILETFGMLHVELHGSNGQKLQIASGHTAQLNIKIDDTQLATCPNIIPLWHFDEVNGYWKQEGTATKTGNYYVGNVGHFSWWNCDTFSSTVNLTVTVVDSSGNPISNIGVNLVENSSNFNSNIKYTDNNGQISGLIPRDQSLTLNIYNPNCGIIFSSNIGSFSSDTILQNIVLSNNSTVENTVVEGTLLKCNNSVVTNGYILYDSQLFPVSNGNFSFTTVYCSSNTNFSLIGIDYDSQQETNSINYHFTSPITNLGNLITCNTVSEFLTYKIDNLPVKTYITNLRCTTSNPSGPPTNYIISRMSDNMSSLEFTLSSSNQIIGTFNTNIYTASGIDFQINSAVTNNISFNLSSFGAVGQYVDVTFNGNYNDNLGSQHTINGVAHVLRDN